MAVSGGKDSMVLLDLLQKGEFFISVAHCNFQLRGEASDGDAQFVESYCSERSIPVFIKRFETERFATERHISTQMAARELRYAWFDELMKSHSFDYLLTAHHLNDALETALLNFSKGTGIAGLRGILTKNETTVRPLLFAERTEIEAYIVAEKLLWREDASNSSVKYQRNLLRHNVVPILKEINPSIEQGYFRTQKRLLAIEAIAIEAFENFKANFVKMTENGWELSVSDLSSEKAFFYVEELLKPYHFTFSQIENILESLDKSDYSVFETTQARLTKERGILKLKEKKAVETENSMVLFLAIGDSIELKNGQRLYVEKCSTFPSEELLRNPSSAFFDAEKLSFPLKIRKWQEGDWFVPFGMKGKKLLSDFFVDKKFTFEQKKAQWIIESNGQIVWLVGHRTDNRFRIQPNTQHIVSVTFELANPNLS